MERYFIVFYAYRNKSGSSNFVTLDGEYLRFERTINGIAFVNNFTDISNITITNIMELSKADFENWNN